MSQQSSQQIVHEIADLRRGTKFLLLAPLVKERKGEHRDVLEPGRARRASRARASTAWSSPSRTHQIRLDKKKKHSIDVVVDRLVAKDGHGRSACTTRWRRRCATAAAS